MAQHTFTDSTDAAPASATPNAVELVQASTESRPSRLVLVTTKMRPPKVRDQLVSRPELLGRLTDGAGMRLTLVASPAGYGKTSLLAAWYAEAARERATAWVTLDKHDNDPVVMWSYILEALRRVSPDISDVVSSPVVGAHHVLEMFLPRLINWLDEQPGITLVLDDFHVLDDGPSREGLNWLIEQADGTLQVVVASRTEPVLPLASMRGHGQLLELRAADLAFTVAEADEFLNGKQLLGLSNDDVKLLVERTHGWPAGIYLAALSLRRAEDRHDLVARFGASNRHVVDFLETEVLASHDQSDRDFLIRGSVLNRMSGPSCDYVLQTADSAEILLRISRSNLFLVPEDDDGSWYRCHPLFAQLLNVELARHDPELAKELHRRAYFWTMEHGAVGDSVDHAIKADMYDEAAALVGSSWIEYANAGRHATVQTWLRSFPPAFVEADPRLLLAEGWMQWLTGQHDEIDDTILRIECALESHRALRQADLPDVVAGLATLKATLPRGVDGDLGTKAVAVAERGSVWRPVACWARALGLYGNGDIPDADLWFEEAIEAGPAAGQLLVTGSSLGYRSLIAGERGDRDAQARLADEAMEFMQARGLEDYAVDAWHAAGVALAAQGRQGEAVPKFKRALEVARSRGQAVLLARALRSYAATLREIGESDLAAANEAEATALLERNPDPRMMAARALRARATKHPRTFDRNGALTERELAVLEMMTTDLSESDIARELFVSHSTVHSHARAIYRKLDVSSRAGALVRARDLGILHVR